MNILTLNTHSWMEENPKEKFELLLETILEKNFDVICLQEVNQEITTSLAKVNDLYHPVASAEPIHQDHFAALLVERLSEKGQDYYWTWSYNHIGYDRYHEGVAILSKTPIKASEVLVSDVTESVAHHVRRVSLVETKVGEKEIAVASVHLSWWDKGFQGEWQKLQSHLKQLHKPLILAGDFNNPEKQEGYQMILNSSLELQDSFTVAKNVYGSYTVGPGIDGWKDNEEPLRIDYIFTTKDWIVDSLEVIFDGKNKALVSDHYGLVAKMTL